MKPFSANTFILLFILFLGGCKTNHGYTSKPTKNNAGPDDNLPEVNTIAYHINDSLTSVYLEIKNDNLLYKRPDTTTIFYANLKVSYKLLSEAGSKKILDSASFYLFDHSQDEIVRIKPLTLKFKVKAFTNHNYYLDLETIDINKKTRYTSGLRINKLNRYSAQNFLASVRDTVAFKNNFPPDETVKVAFVNSAIRDVTVQCFFKEFGPALPPFSLKEPEEFKYKPDSAFILNLNTNSFLLKMPAQGFYHVMADQDLSNGFSLYTYDKSFPGVGNVTEMIKSCRYIMEKTEYETCLNAVDKKAAIDNFWLTVAGSNERARELLKRYYGRVREANQFYSAYTQGWKSDRGMVFIVFGPPTNIYKSKKDEIWVYGNEANPSALRFIFNKTGNPFSDNDYVLERSPFFKDAWYTAVEYWRQGNVYLDGRR
ncbi:MAG: GWxTD domain-containing protein [Bacteroidia bacterium]|nr:GWxTD domain-containing protein [Bacteroidia bacterium]